MTKKQLSQRRNWTKCRLLGFTLDTGALTEREKHFYDAIKAIQKQMIDEWELNGVELGFKPERYNVFIDGEPYRYQTKKQMQNLKRIAKEENWKILVNKVEL